MPGTNTLAYYGNPEITTAISFIVQATGVIVIKLVFPSLTKKLNKVECLSPEILSRLI